jgi:Na+/melibiose symporter-like transporter
LLASYGFVEKAATQAAPALLGIRLTASVYAGLAFAATAGCLFFYPITREVNRKVADELSERRKKYAPAS